VLDPDERLRRSAHTLLERKGCIVETVGMAKEAIAMATVGEYNIILMSVKLKDMRGTETFFALAKAAPHAKMILLRGFGHDDGHTEVNARLAGYHPSVLFKPFQEEYLYPALANMAPSSSY
jgi:DNA-binding NtrC family response regulator